MKYIFINDIEYLIHNKKKLLLILFILPLIFLLININIDLPCIDLINLTMATNFNIDSYTILELMMFIFNIVIYLYFIVDIYIKDIEYQLDNIFLRLSPNRWYLKKTSMFCLLMFFTKFIQYLMVGIILLIKNKLIITDILYVMLLDYIYILLLQFLFLLIYIISLCLFKNKLITFIPFLTIMYFIPKNIYDSRKLIWIFMLIIFFMNAVNYIILINKNKKIIENCRR